MAHILLVTEPDPALRAEFSRKAFKRFSQMPGLHVESLSAGNCVVFQASHRHAPSDTLKNENQCALLLGYALNDRGIWLNAAQYFSEWPAEPLPPPAHDGYFVGVRYEVGRGLTVEVDPWGLFPLYYTRVGSTLIAGSSAEFFHCHPRFIERLDPGGLTGILLTNGLVAGRTLIQGVKQLDCGHCLFSDGFGNSRELETYRPSVNSPREQVVDDQILAETHHAIHQAVTRHRPKDASTAIMLSGGLDSRLMAGYLSELGIGASAVTLGLPTDFEVQAACRVASTLGMPSAVFRDHIAQSRVPELARSLAREQHLSGGFSNLEFGANNLGLNDLARFSWSGLFVDDLLGGCGAWFGFSRDTQQWSCDAFLGKLHRWAISPDDCRKLVNLPPASAGEIVRDCIQQLHTEWSLLPGDAAQRSMLLKLRTRMRYHISAALHRMSFSSWPLLPLLDRQFVEFMLQIPAAAVQNCRLQNRLMMTQFPALARIPLDDNSFTYAPLESKFRQIPPSLHNLIDSGRKRWNTFYWQYWKRTEPRRYFRTYDLNSELWRLVRLAAEPSRLRLEPWLVPSQVDSIVPAPGIEIRVKDRFREGSQIRTLLGLMLWSSDKSEPETRAA